jgi:hypothetical protein
MHRFRLRRATQLAADCAPRESERAMQHSALKKQQSTIMHQLQYNNPEVAESVTCKVELARLALVGEDDAPNFVLECLVTTKQAKNNRSTREYQCL